MFLVAPLQDTNISSEISFAQNSGGKSSMIGTFVPTSGLSGLSRSGGRGFRGGSSTRHITVERGRQKIQATASILRLGRDQVDAAVRLLTLAVEHNFTQGRNMEDVCGACLYIVCRREKSAHMLLDFAECLQRSIYSLGQTYLKLTRLLKLELPLIDPSLYIHRFASRLEFGDKYYAVARTALKLVGRMKRDWLAVGRKPSGICAAALIIAARIHGFRRSTEEVRKVVRVAPSTVAKRLKEFAATPTSQLTWEQFQKEDAEAGPAFDPPAFIKQKSEQDSTENIEWTADAAAASSSGDVKRIAAAPVAVVPPKAQAMAPPSASGVAAEGRSDTRPEDFYGEDDNATLSDVDDAELENLLLTDGEVAEKTKLWHEMNDGYLKEMEQKRILAEKMGKVPRKKRKKRKRADYSADNAHDAALNVIRDKNISNKINLKALEALFPEAKSSSAADPAMPQGAAAESQPTPQAAETAPAATTAVAPTT